MKLRTTSTISRLHTRVTSASANALLRHSVIIESIFPTKSDKFNSELNSRNTNIGSDIKQTGENSMPL